MVPPGLPVSLMQPTLVSAPFHREGWVYEEKYNGWRMVAYKREGQGRLISRQGKVLHAPLPRAGCR
jgi:ATP-dependent DNA ligase